VTICLEMQEMDLIERSKVVQNREAESVRRAVSLEQSERALRERALQVPFVATNSWVHVCVCTCMFVFVYDMYVLYHSWDLYVCMNE
jgi:hypothetical protein